MEQIETNEFTTIRKIKLIILFLSVIGIIMITKEVFTQEIMTLDKIGYQFIARYLISDCMTPITKIITKCGGVLILLLSTIASLVFIKNKKIGIAITLNLLMSTGLNLILKNIIQRPRPIEYRLIDETGYSFPSGHSMVSMAFYGFIIYLIYKNIKNSKLKVCLMIILSMLIVLIGMSRIYLGVHYTSDVIAGFLIAVSYLMLYISVLKRTLLKEE